VGGRVGSAIVEGTNIVRETRGIRPAGPGAHPDVNPERSRHEESKGVI